MCELAGLFFGRIQSRRSDGEASCLGLCEGLEDEWVKVSLREEVSWQDFAVWFYVCGESFGRTDLERFDLDEANVRVYSGVYAW